MSTTKHESRATEKVSVVRGELPIRSQTRVVRLNKNLHVTKAAILGYITGTTGDEDWPDLFDTDNLFRISPQGFVQIVNAGVKPAYVDLVANKMRTNKTVLLNYLRLPATTVERKRNKAAHLDIDQSERLAGLQRLIDQVRAMVEDSGNAEGFDAAQWLGRWIERPLPALGGKKPAEYLSTVSGQNLISDLLRQTQSGAYA